MTSIPNLPLAKVQTDPGFAIGWDRAHYRLVQPVDQLLPGNTVRDGWEAGQAVFRLRTLRATPHVKKWLQLRLGAWMRGKAFDLVQVTPNSLERIDTEVDILAQEFWIHASDRAPYCWAQANTRERVIDLNPCSPTLENHRLRRGLLAALALRRHEIPHPRADLLAASDDVTDSQGGYVHNVQVLALKSDILAM